MTRIISGLSLLALLVVSVYILPSPTAEYISFIIVGLAIYELLNVSKNSIIQKTKYFITFFGTLIYFLFYLGNSFALLYTFTLVMVLIILFIKEHEKMNFNDLFFIFIAILVLPHGIISILNIYLLEHGKWLILIPMITSWGSDVMAYTVGKAIGKHKLAPKISPNKTIEGSIGGILGGIIGMLIFGYFTSNFIEIPMIMLIIIGIFGAIVGQLGDLLFSMVKRQSGLKDFSNLIPGHGGILDRFDSIILNAPIAFALLSLI